MIILTVVLDLNGEQRPPLSVGHRHLIKASSSWGCHVVNSDGARGDVEFVSLLSAKPHQRHAVIVSLRSADVRCWRSQNGEQLETGYAVTSKGTDTDWLRKLTVGIIVLLLRGVPVFDINQISHRSIRDDVLYKNLLHQDASHHWLMWHTLCAREPQQTKETIPMSFLIFVMFGEHFGILQLFGICCNVIVGTIKDTPTETVLDFPSLFTLFFSLKMNIHLFSSEHWCFVL